MTIQQALSTEHSSTARLLSRAAAPEAAEVAACISNDIDRLVTRFADQSAQGLSRDKLAKAVALSLLGNDARLPDILRLIDRATPRFVNESADTLDGYEEAIEELEGVFSDVIDDLNKNLRGLLS